MQTLTWTLATATVLAATVSAATVSAAPQGDPPGEEAFNHCSQIPPDEPSLKLTIKPNSEVADVIGWINTISCTKVVVASGQELRGKKVTIQTPGLISRREAWRLFVRALNTVDLTVQASPGDKAVLKVIGTKPTRE